MLRRALLSPLAVLLLAVVVLALRVPRPQKSPGIVVTTTMLECAVRDLLPADAGIPVLALIPPGSCPGHFDVPPSVVPTLRTAAVVVAHDYQQDLAGKLAELGPPGTKVVQIETKGSLLIPEHYLCVTQQLSDVLVSAYPNHEARIRAALKAVEQKSQGLAERASERRAAWEGMPAIVSAMQRQFCEWLKLRVVGQVARPEDVTPAELQALLNSKPALVVANLQEGRHAAQALAERLAVPLVVFSNFPGAEGYGHGYEELLNENLRRLEESCRKR